jgi:hypothetical protein
MRDLLRLIGIAILVFAIVGFAMIYSRDSVFRYGVASFISGTAGGISRGFSDLTGLGRDADGVELEATTLRIVRPSQTDWLGLTGLPDQTVVHFSVPQVGGYVEGRLDLRFDIQLADGGDALLSIGVNGQRRSEVVLNAGSSAYDVSIPLINADLLTDRVVVELAARGTTNSGQICPTSDSNSGSAISLLPESAMVLTTLQSANDPQTALIAAPDPLRLHLGQDRRTQGIAIWAAQHMARAGVPSVLVDDPLTPGRIVVTDAVIGTEAVELDSGGNIVLNGVAGLRYAIQFHRADAVAPALLSDWPVSVGQLTTETMVRSFRGSKRWIIPYKIADLPGGMTPTRFDLALSTSLLAQDRDWMVHVSLNGNLLQTARLPGNMPDIAIPVQLPIALQGLVNSLVVELIDTSPNEGVCGAAVVAKAQLLSDSQLVASGTQPVDGWGGLVRQLARAPFVVPGNPGLLSVNQATRVAAALSQFLPAEANVAFEAEGPAMTITVMNKVELATVLRLWEPADVGSQLWVITSGGDDGTDTLGLHDARTKEGAEILEQLHSNSMAILVQTQSAQ